MALSNEQLRNLEKKLLEMKEEIENKTGGELFEESLSESTGELTNGLDNHFGDLSSEQYDRERQQTIDLIDEKMLTEIEQSLQMMKDGTYGTCVDTGEEIPYERLEALPYAKRTAAAQQKFEDDRANGLSNEESFEKNMKSLADRDTIDEESSITIKALRREQDSFAE